MREMVSNEKGRRAQAGDCSWQHSPEYLLLTAGVHYQEALTV